MPLGPQYAQKIRKQNYASVPSAGAILAAGAIAAAGPDTKAAATIAAAAAAATIAGAGCSDGNHRPGFSDAYGGLLGGPIGPSRRPMGP